MNKKAVAIACWILGGIGVIAGFIAAQDEYSNTLNQLGNYFGAGRSFFTLLVANPFFLMGVVGLVVGFVLTFSSSSSPSLSPPSSVDSRRSEPAEAASSGRPHATTRVCPFCAEQINAQAIKCRHCGSMLEAREE